MTTAASNSTPTFDDSAFAEQWEEAVANGAALGNAHDAYEAFDAWQLDPAYVFPPELLYALRIEDREAVLKTAGLRAELRRRSGFVVPATDSRGRNGWFPIGQPSTFIGFSGAGKTKLILQMLDAMRTGEKFLGSRVIPPKSILWIQQDRNLEQLYDSLEDLFGDREPWFECEPPIVAQNGAAIEEIAALLQKHDYPEICIVDGLDIILSDLRGPALKAMFPKLQRVAQVFGCALIGTWGSPKRQATKDGYSEVRLAATGASEIGRLSATAALVTVDKDNKAARKLEVATRRSNDDVYQLLFREDSWLIPTDAAGLAKLKVGTAKDPVAILKAHGLGYKDVKDLLRVSRASWHRHEPEEEDGKEWLPSPEELTMCACGCGRPVIVASGAKPGKWATDACRKRAKRLSVF